MTTRSRTQYQWLRGYLPKVTIALRSVKMTCFRCEAATTVAAAAVTTAARIK